MSTLGQAIAAKLGMPASDVDAILVEHHVSSAAAPSTASKLRLGSLRFEAVKTLTGVRADGAEADKDFTEQVPVSFSWTFGIGLHGVGSEKNLRGKSSITRILLWALRGRCDLRDDVRKWLRRIELDFYVDSIEYQLAFDINDGIPVGTLNRLHNGTLTRIGSFGDDDEFEETMGSTMLNVLSLSPIAAAQEGQRTQHAWPSYAGALVVRGDSLDLLLGDTRFAGLPSRLLQMFVGSDWAAARAEAATAHSVAKTNLAALEEKVSDRAKMMADAYRTALQDVAQAKDQLTMWPPARTALADIDAALNALPKLDEQVMASTVLVAQAKNNLDHRTQQLKLAEIAANAAIEDALAHRFFQQLRPTVCPRCSAPVSAARREEEAKGHSCSVCVNDLDLDAYDNDQLLAATATTSTIPAASREVADDDEDVVNDIEALMAAVEDAAARLTGHRAELREVSNQREAAAAVIASASEQAELHQARRNAELVLARAEGIAQALQPEAGAAGLDRTEHDRSRTHVKVLKAAEQITSVWVTTPQRDRLDVLSIRITELARSFGMANLTAVALNGGARMSVTTGGQTTPYSKCERGEMLRLKLATAIALIEQARLSGIGRHPGLLFVDSPGAEEMDEDDFDTMLGALNLAATQSDIQIIVATRHVDALLGLLDENRCRVARGNNFVW